MAKKLPRGAVPTPLDVLVGSISHQITGGTPENWITIPPAISFWGNYVDGDCVTAEEAFAKACHRPEILITDQVAVQWAADRGFLNGARFDVVLKLMRNDGFRQDGYVYCDGEAHTVKLNNPDVLHNAIAQGPVKLGIAANQLETLWHLHESSGWIATGLQPEAPVDHCVSLCGFGSINWLAQQLKVQVPAGIDGTQPGYAMFTWGSIGIIDRPSLLNIAHEAWLRKPTTVIRQLEMAENPPASGGEANSSTLSSPVAGRSGTVSG